MHRHTVFPVIAFVGGGNMTTAMVGGLIANRYPSNAIIVAEPSNEKAVMLEERFGICTTVATPVAVEQAQIVILAVKPQVIEAVASEIAATPGIGAKLFVCIAAGIRLALLEAFLGSGTAIIRAMPNTPALVGCAATAIYANARTSQEQITMATTIMESFGICLTLHDENQLDAVTAISGSGPAYFFLLMEEMIRAGCRVGLSEHDAMKLTLQTALGATHMALTGEESPSQLRMRVTSPNGTTQCAIDSMQQGGFGALIERAVQCAHRRAVDLGVGRA